MTLFLRTAAITRQSLDTIRFRCSSSGLLTHVGQEAELLARMVEGLASTAIDEIEDFESQRRALVHLEMDADAEAAKQAAARHLRSLESQKSLMTAKNRRELTAKIRHEMLAAIASWLARADETTEMTSGEESSFSSGECSPIHGGAASTGPISGA